MFQHTVSEFWQAIKTIIAPIECTNCRTELVDALATNWNEGKKQLFRGILSGFFKSVNPEIAGYCMDAEDAQSKG